MLRTAGAPSAGRCTTISWVSRASCRGGANPAKHAFTPAPYRFVFCSTPTARFAATSNCSESPPSACRIGQQSSGGSSGYRHYAAIPAGINFFPCARCAAKNPASSPRKVDIDAREWGRILSALLNAACNAHSTVTCTRYSAMRKSMSARKAVAISSKG